MPRSTKSCKKQKVEQTAAQNDQGNKFTSPATRSKAVANVNKRGKSVNLLNKVMGNMNNNRKPVQKRKNAEIQDNTSDHISVDSEINFRIKDAKQRKLIAPTAVSNSQVDKNTLDYVLDDSELDYYD